MKILYLNHPEADYGGYGLYDGLCRILGVENVVDFPHKRSYHGEVHRYPNQYPSHYPPRSGEVDPNDMSGITGPFEWAKNWKAREYGEREVREMLAAGAFDLVVCESPRRVSLATMRLLKNALPPRILLHDGEDYRDIRTEFIDEFGVGMYLKREVFRDTVREYKGCIVKPFTFSACVYERPAEAERIIDVLCAVGDTHPVRKKIKALVNRLGEEGYEVDTSHCGWPEYMAKIGRSKIAVAPRGFGQDTLRRWDIPAMGALLLGERLDLVENRPLLDGVHMVAYASDGSDFEEKVRFWIANDDRRRAVARAGQDFVFEYHTSSARAREALGWAVERWPELRGK